MIVYKYRGGDNKICERDLDALKNDYFWASSVKELNDPCEKMIDKDNFISQIENILKLFKKNNSEVNEKFAIVRKELDNLINRDIGIFSLSKNNLDELLWAHYGNSHKGFCIAYDLDKLTENNSIIKYYPFHVTYSQKPPQVSIKDMQNLTNDLTKNSLIRKITSIKSKRWKNEQEVRIITDNWGKHDYDFRALKAIYFGLRMDNNQKEKVMSELRGREINYYQTQLDTNSYKFYFIPVPDSFANSEKYLSKIATVSDGAIDEKEVKKENQKYIPYLYDAVEIARQEPYCEHVYYAEFSFTKSKKDNPVIFVNCKKTNRDFDNYYYTIAEIKKKIKRINSK